MLVKLSKIIFNQTRERRHVVTTIELCYIFLQFLYSAVLFERPDYSEAWGTLEVSHRFAYILSLALIRLCVAGKCARFMQPQNVLPSSRSGNAFRLVARVGGKLLLRGQL